MKPATPSIVAEREFFREHPGAVLDEQTMTQAIGIVPAPEIEYQVEDYEDVLPELKSLLQEHWQEIALDQEAIKLDPDYETYAVLAKAGALHLVTVRADGWLVGYHLSIIKPHLHYKSSLTCFTDVFFLKKKYRNWLTGYKLLKIFRDSVRERGVQKIYMNTKLALDVGPLIERLGFRPIERLYTLVFKE